MTYPHPDKIIDYLWRSTEGRPLPQVYAILDAARREAVYKELVGSQSEYCCLYRGSKARELADVAPYLVNLQKEASFTRWLIGHGWGDSWGIFLESSASLREVRQHFRKFLMVHDEEGKPLYFRYYDPRVLRVYLPTCNESELNILFGPVNRYNVEAEDHNVMIEYLFSKGELIQNIVQMTTPAEQKRG
jgi:hypothetical protein